MPSLKSLNTILFGFLLSVIPIGIVASQRPWLNPYRQTVHAESSISNPGESRSFAERCRGKAVLVCEGFDDPGEFLVATWPGSGLYPGSCRSCDFRDTSIKASGASSYRMQIPGRSSDRPAGNWVQRFDQVFGAHSTFYVSFSFRVDHNWLAIDWRKVLNTAPKIVIFHNLKGGTCAQTEITTRYDQSPGYPIAYVECGARGLYTNSGNPPYLLQQGDYQCWWGEQGATGKCWDFHPDEWETFYYKISIGTWGKPDSAIEAWVAREGHVLQKWLDLPKFVLHSDSAGFDALTLTQYMTNKNPAIDHPSAYVWYDDLIVSSEPIPPPTGPLPPSRTP